MKEPDQFESNDYNGQADKDGIYRERLVVIRLEWRPALMLCAYPAPVRLCINEVSR